MTKDLIDAFNDDFHQKYPFYNDVFFSRHAIERLKERFGKPNSQLFRAIIRAVKELKEKPHWKYAKGQTFGADMVVARESNCYVVVTSWNKDIKQVR